MIIQVCKKIVYLVFRLCPLTMVCCLIKIWLKSLTQYENTRRFLQTLFALDNYLQETINVLAIKYDNGIHVKHRLTNYHQYFLKHINQNKNILDIGCGTGSLAFDIANVTSGTVFAIDIEECNIKQACERYKKGNLVFQTCDAWEWDTDNQIDIIIMSNVLEHIEDRISFMQKIQSRFNPEKWLIRVPRVDRDWSVPFRKELGVFYYLDRTHYVEYTEETLRQELVEANMEIVAIESQWSEFWVEVIYVGVLNY